MDSSTYYDDKLVLRTLELLAERAESPLDSAFAVRVNEIIDERRACLLLNKSAGPEEALIEELERLGLPRERWMLTVMEAIRDEFSEYLDNLRSGEYGDDVSPEDLSTLRAEMGSLKVQLLHFIAAIDRKQAEEAAKDNSGQAGC